MLTKGSPIADMVYGIDNTFVSRAADEGVLADYTPDDDPGACYEPQDDDLGEQVTAVDYSDVCVNVDDTWFEEKGIDPPASLRGPDANRSTAACSWSRRADHLLARPRLPARDDLAVRRRRLAGLLGPAARPTALKVTSGWSDAYQVDFTAGGGEGDRPIVLSYASSPPFTIPEDGDEADDERAARHLLPAGGVRRACSTVPRTPRAPRRSSTSW